MKIELTEVISSKLVVKSTSRDVRRSSPSEAASCRTARASAKAASLGCVLIFDVSWEFDDCGVVSTFVAWLFELTSPTLLTTGLKKLSGNPESKLAGVKFPGTGVEFPVAGPQLPGSGPQLSGAGPQLPGGGPQLSGAGPQLPGGGPQLSGAGLQLPGAGPQLPGAGPQLPRAGPQLLGASLQLSGAGIQLPGGICSTSLGLLLPWQFSNDGTRLRHCIGQTLFMNLSASVLSQSLHATIRNRIWTYQTRRRWRRRAGLLSGW